MSWDGMSFDAPLDDQTYHNPPTPYPGAAVPDKLSKLASSNKDISSGILFLSIGPETGATGVVHDLMGYLAESQARIRST
jgi:hypothetical protein